MSRRKQYKNRLPTVLAPLPPPVSPDLDAVHDLDDVDDLHDLDGEPSAPPAPPAPRAVPEAEQVPRPAGAPPVGPPVPPADAPRSHPPVPVRRRRTARAAVTAVLLLVGAATAVRRHRGLVTVAVLLVLLAGATVAGVLALRPGDGPGLAETAGPGAEDPLRGAGPVLPGTSQVETVVRPNGTVVVRHRLLSREPLRSLTLALPPLEGAGTVAATDLRVVADGEPVAGPALVGPRGADFDLGSATDLRVTYRLTGVVLVSGSAPGRALALTTSLAVRTDPAPDEEVRVVRAPRVLSLACAGAGDGPPEPCGTAQGLGAWRVDLAGARLGDRVVAQLTVPGLDGVA